jgi:rubrerythrin
MSVFERYLITCKKCGYTWLSHSPNPKRCAMCNNPEPEKPYIRKETKEEYISDYDNR